MGQAQPLLVTPEQERQIAAWLRGAGVEIVASGGLEATAGRGGKGGGKISLVNRARRGGRAGTARGAMLSYALLGTETATAGIYAWSEVWWTGTAWAAKAGGRTEAASGNMREAHNIPKLAGLVLPFTITTRSDGGQEAVCFLTGFGQLTPLSTIGANSEGSETADTGTWTRGDHAVEVWVTLRVVYNDAGDQVLYSYARKFTYDTLGMLYSISAETRISVDAPGAC